MVVQEKKKMDVPDKINAQPSTVGSNGNPGEAELGEDADDVKGFEFNDQIIRKAFVRKVYSILMCQLLVTLGFIALFLFCEPLRLWVTSDFAILLSGLIVSMVVGFIALIVLACCNELTRTFPVNFIILGVFTVGMGTFLGILSSMIKVSEVMIAVGATAAVCLALTLFAFQTKWDFTMLGGCLITLLVVTSIYGAIPIFLPAYRTFELGGAAGGTLLFSFYLVYDTQAIMGGKRFSISPEDYIFAAVLLYVDILRIFLFILQIMAAAKSRENRNT